MSAITTWFSKTRPNRWLFTFTTLPMFMSGHHAWWIEHHVHHNDLGAKKDFITRRRTAILLTRQHRLLFFTKGPVYRFCCAALFTCGHALRAADARASILQISSRPDCLHIRISPRDKLDPGPKALSILADEHLISGYESYGLKRWLWLPNTFDPLDHWSFAVGAGKPLSFYWRRSYLPLVFFTHITLGLFSAIHISWQ